ncbi:MAG: hypothetical protein ACI8WM_001080 [Burkholderiaceae bacterium]|jgi:hypothetical protein
MKIGHRLVEAIKDSVSGLGNAIKTGIQACGESFKGVLTSALNVVKAVATGDVKGLATACMDLAANIGSLATAPMDMAATLAMDLVKQTMTMAAGVVGKGDAPMLKNLMAAIDTAKSFKDLADPAALLGEAASLMSGEKGDFEKAIDKAKDLV